jgi:hypothetical protein
LGVGFGGLGFGGLGFGGLGFGGFGGGGGGPIGSGHLAGVSVMRVLADDTITPSQVPSTVYSIMNYPVYRLTTVIVAV